MLALVAGVSAAVSPASAEVPRHIHNLTTPGTTTTIAGGVTENAPCTASLNFHENVHVGVFVAGDNPNTVAPAFVDGVC